MARFCEEVKVLWAALSGAGFMAVGPEGDLISGDDLEQGVEQSGLLTWFALGGMNDIGKVP